MKLHQLLALVLLLPVGSLMAAEETLVEHEGHRGLWLRSDAAEVFIGIEPQFRVLSFRRPGEPSLMAGQNVAETGLRLAFMEPDQVPASFDVGNVPAEVLERTPRSVRVRLKAAAGLQYTVRMQLDEADPALMLWYELANAGDKPRQVACWSVTSFARQGMIIAPFDQQPRARRRVVLPWWTRWPQPGVAFGRDALAVDAAAPVVGNACKVGLINNTGWIAFRRGDQALISRVAFEADSIYPEDGANVTLFLFDGEQRNWCEIEQVGPLRELAPGASVSMQETLRLLTLAGPADADPDAQRITIEAAANPPADPAPKHD